MRLTLMFHWHVRQDSWKREARCTNAVGLLWAQSHDTRTNQDALGLVIGPFLVHLS